MPWEWGDSIGPGFAFSEKATFRQFMVQVNNRLLAAHHYPNGEYIYQGGVPDDPYPFEWTPQQTNFALHTTGLGWPPSVFGAAITAMQDTLNQIRSRFVDPNITLAGYVRLGFNFLPDGITFTAESLATALGYRAVNRRKCTRRINSLTATTDYQYKFVTRPSPEPDSWDLEVMNATVPIGARAGYYDAPASIISTAATHLIPLENAFLGIYEQTEAGVWEEVPQSLPDGTWNPDCQPDLLDSENDPAGGYNCPAGLFRPGDILSYHLFDEIYETCILFDTTLEEIETISPPPEFGQQLRAGTSTAATIATAKTNADASWDSGSWVNTDLTPPIPPSNLWNFIMMGQVSLNAGGTSSTAQNTATWAKLYVSKLWRGLAADLDVYLYAEAHSPAANQDTYFDDFGFGLDDGSWTLWDTVSFAAGSQQTDDNIYLGIDYNSSQLKATYGPDPAAGRESFNGHQVLYGVILVRWTF